MNAGLLLLLAVVTAPWLGPNVRIDHQYLPKHILVDPAIAVGPGTPSSQPLYVTFEDDTLPGGRSDVWFQKSSDGGRTWLPEDLLIRRGERYAFNPDITTDSDGNVYIVFMYEPVDTVRHIQILCVRSSDGGTTWSAPSRVDGNSNGVIGWSRIASDSAGNLFCAWNDWRTGSGHIWSSVSTDQGATWSKNVRVDDDTTDYDCYQPDVFVQPGTNHYLVTAQAPRWVEGHIRLCAYLYRSTDRGLTFQPGVQLDTFSFYAGQPRVVADRDHIVCDYGGAGESLYGHQNFTESRTFYSGPDTWSHPVAVHEPDSIHSSYYDGGKLALSADGHVHAALTICDTGLYHVYYTSSADHGVSWSDLELVDEDTTLSSACPDIGADSAGHAYVVWSHGDDGEFRIWFATNNPVGIAEEPTRQPTSVQPSATVVRNVLSLPEASSHKPQAAGALLDISGRQVMVLKPGANDVRALAPGVYFMREEPQASSPKPQVVRKVVVTR
jgi:hypothetical protein